MKFRKRFTAMLLIAFVFVFAAQINVFSAKPIKGTSTIAAPTGLTASGITSTEISLSWNGVSGAAGYKVYAASPSDASYTQIATVTGTTYKHAGLLASTSYWYYIKAYSNTATSVDSTHINAMTQAVVVPPPTPTGSKIVMGYAVYYYSGDKSSLNSMTTNSSLINQIATETYTTDGIGNLSGMVSSEQIAYAKSVGMKAYVMVANKFDGAVAKTLLESSTNRQNLINNIITQIKANGYDGVNIDLEGVYYYDRGYLTTFMSELYSQLKPLGYAVTMAVPAKTVDSTTNSWNGAFDYAQLAKYSDQMVIMTYDEHYPGGTPGPIASIGWVNNVVNYAVTVIPKEKILLGTAAYGYDWSSNGTKAYSINGVLNLAATYGAQIQWDTVSQSPYFKYTDGAGIAHTVWFENNQSVGYKLDTVNNAGLSGIAIWRLGLENADYWTTIKTKFAK